MSIQTEAKLEVIKDLQEAATEKGADPMTAFAMSINAMAAISNYEKKIEDKLGTFTGLIKALEDGGFSDINGTLITDTLTFKNLKNRLTAEEE